MTNSESDSRNNQNVRCIKAELTVYSIKFQQNYRSTCSSLCNLNTTVWPLNEIPKPSTQTIQSVRMKSKPNQTFSGVSKELPTDCYIAFTVYVSDLRFRLKLTVETKTYGRETDLTEQLRDQLLKLNASQTYHKPYVLS